MSSDRSAIRQVSTAVNVVRTIQSRLDGTLGEKRYGEFFHLRWRWIESPRCRQRKSKCHCHFATISYRTASRLDGWLFDSFQIMGAVSLWGQIRCYCPVLDWIQWLTLRGLYSLDLNTKHKSVCVPVSFSVCLCIWLSLSVSLCLPVCLISWNGIPTKTSELYKRSFALRNSEPVVLFKRRIKKDFSFFPLNLEDFCHQCFFFFFPFCFSCALLLEYPHG